MEYLNERRSLNVLIKFLDSPILTSRTAAIEFLLVMATIGYPQGHQLVIEAFENYCALSGECHLFSNFLKSIADVVQSRGIFGTVVGSKKDTIISFLSHGGKHQEITQRDIKDFLVIFRKLMTSYRALPSFAILSKFQKS
jgi:hypothetical protein